MKIIRLVALALLLFLVRGGGSQQRRSARARYTSEFRQFRLSCFSCFGFCLESRFFLHFGNLFWIRRVDYGVFIFIVLGLRKNEYKISSARYRILTLRSLRSLRLKLPYARRPPEWVSSSASSESAANTIGC